VILGDSEVIPMTRGRGIIVHWLSEREKGCRLRFEDEFRVSTHGSGVCFFLGHEDECWTPMIYHIPY